MIDNTILISGAIVFKKSRGKTFWFVSMNKVDDEEAWEIPKVMVKKTESSVRAAIRMTGEKGGMNNKVLEEVGRAGGSTTVGGKKVPQRYIYYLMVQISAGEILGFEKAEWLIYSKAVRKISSKREQQMLRDAKKLLSSWRKENPDWIKEQKKLYLESLEEEEKSKK